MKQFKDLDITGPDEQLLASVREVSTNLPTKWRRNPEAEPAVATMCRVLGVTPRDGVAVGCPPSANPARQLSAAVGAVEAL